MRVMRLSAVPAVNAMVCLSARSVYHVTLSATGVRGSRLCAGGAPDRALVSRAIAA